MSTSQEPSQLEQIASSTPNSHHASDMEDNQNIMVLPKRNRTDYENNFRKVSILANFYQVKLTEQFDKLYIFSLKINPMIARDNRSKRKQVINELMSEIKKTIQNPTICGMNIISNKQPKEDLIELSTKEFKVSIKKVKVIDCKQDPKTLLFFLNNRLRNVMGEAGFSEIGRTGKYFNIKYKKEIDNLNMYSGYKANFIALQKGIFLRVDNAKKIVRNQTVLEFIKQIYAKNSNRDRQDKRNLVRNALVNQIIQVNYANGRYHKVQEIIYKDMSEEVFGNEKLNLLEYYKTKYNITIRDVKQPLLKAENKKQKDQEILLIPELCLMTGIPQDFDEFKRKKISQQTILDPQTKKRQILGIIKELEKNNDFQQLEKVGLKLNKKLYNFDCKEIQTPAITLGKDQRVQQGKQAFFQLFGQPIYASKHRVKLAILFFRADLYDMIKTFENTSRNLQVELSLDKFEIRDERNAIDGIQKTLKKVKQQNFNIVLIVIPPNMKSQYKRIKEVCLIENDLVCQIACEATLRKKNAQSIATKILLQIIAKRGNTLWVPKTKTSHDNVMLIGIDNATISGNRNILTACGSVNSVYTSIFTKKTQYKGYEDKFSAICQSVSTIVNYYVDRNGCPPKDIVLFMNTVSFDQVKSLKEYFIDIFMKKMDQVYKQKAPAMQVIMVNTKTSERFFTEDGGNVRAGTLINSEIVSKEYDFYMVSQNSNKGCVVPNHYKVIYSNSKMDEGKLAELIFGQCFNYVNWSGSIKVPGILQYAKKSAKFNAEVLQTASLTKEMERCLYFV